MPIVWTLPTGLNVNQFYEQSEDIRIKPFSHKKTSFKLLIGNKKLNKSKQIRALMPNLIHSLDGASIALLIDILYKNSEDNIQNINLFTVHDCFAVPANKVEYLISSLKLVYVHLYSNTKSLKDFDMGIRQSIKWHFGEAAFDDKTLTVKVNGSNFDFPNVEDILLGQITKMDIINSNYIIS